MIRLTTIEQKYRNKIYKDLWDTYKGDLTMTDLAKLLRVDVSLLFYVLKKENENTKSV